ncbi:glycosyltransferase family A protein [Lichenicola sp.]|uniref:glycosyltransferase family A protein n=1 Tax=Lichenicola sp. TaxID=2804529 RepID=UPI003AFF689D
MTVAIVLRTHDRPILLARALASVLAQTHEAWQLTLLNTGDPAPVDALVAVYRVAFAGRLVVRHETHTPTLAELVPAPPVRDRPAPRYWALHDDDDAWHPDFLRLALGFLEHPERRAHVAVATHCWQVTERIEAGGIVEEARGDAFSAPHPVAVSALLTGAVLPSICVLARAEVLAGLPAPALAADLVLGLALAGEIGVIPRRLAFRYRRSSRVGPYANRSTRPENDAPGLDIAEANQRLRELAAREPALLGLIPATASLLAEETRRVTALLDRNAGWGHGRHADLQERLIRIETALEALIPSESAASGFEMAGPAARKRILDGVRRASLPPRRLLARLRGRI